MVYAHSVCSGATLRADSVLQQICVFVCSFLVVVLRLNRSVNTGRGKIVSADHEEVSVSLLSQSHFTLSLTTADICYLLFLMMASNLSFLSHYHFLGVPFFMTKVRWLTLRNPVADFSMRSWLVSTLFSSIYILPLCSSTSLIQHIGGGPWHRTVYVSF